MKDLISRLEKASGPDREIDGRIWAELAGRDVRVARVEHWGEDGLLAKSRTAPYDECVVCIRKKYGFMTVGQSNPPLQYTLSIDAALTLVPDGLDYVLRSLRNNAEARVGGAKDEYMIKGGQHPFPAIALCIAALKARLAVDQVEP